jgi:DNA-binding beta-propeller fold protein YncE
LATLGATSAHAAITFSSSFGTAGGGGGQFANPSGVAINNTTGDSYVADTGNNRIQQFDSSGNFVRMWGQNVNQTTTGNVCPVAPADVCKAGQAGTAAGAFSSPSGIAVDNSGGPTQGAVYVQDTGNNRVQRFTSSGAFVLAWGKEVNLNTGGDICPVAPADVCKAGNTTGTFAGAIGATPSGEAIPPDNIGSAPGQFSGWKTNAPLIAVDGDGEVFVGDPQAVPGPERKDEVEIKDPLPRIEKFDANGQFLGQIAGPAFNPGDRGISNLVSFAVNHAGDVYVADSEAIERFDANSFSASGISAAYSKVYERLFGSTRVAIDPQNQFLLTGGSAVVPKGGGDCNQLGYHVLEYHPGGQEVDCTIPKSPSISDGAALAVSPAKQLLVADDNQVLVFALPLETAPTTDDGEATGITSDSAVIKAQVSGNLLDTTVQVEYGLEPCSLQPCATTTDVASIGSVVPPATVAVHVEHLDPATPYYFRVRASNGKGSVIGGEGHLVTFTKPSIQSCPNDLARQQTGGSHLLDCRAYELVSAEDQGGYNVVSDLIPGQEPFGGYPLASGKAMYAVDSGGIPGSGKPTNRGSDPYLATRDPEHQRWTSEYVGIPGDAPSIFPFSSTLATADSGLDTFAFSGAEICDPCFTDGSAGIPLRLPGGSLVQGMVGSIPVADPVPTGEVRKGLSGDGSHFIFASEQQFESEGNSDDGQVTIYDRDLATDKTQVVSTDPSGTTIAAGQGVSELDISADGTRILVGRLVRTDSLGNEFWHLYMHVGTSPKAIDLTPGVTGGVLYAGMNAVGSAVYFTTADPLADDTDDSVDLFRAEVSSSSASVSLVSVGAAGAAGNTDACDPADNSTSLNWNSEFEAPTDCSVVAVAGGGGVARSSGAVYFLSPEVLDSTGTTLPVDGAPNVYLAVPGQPPEFVVGLESGLTAVQPHVYLYKRSSILTGFTRVTGLDIDRAAQILYGFDFSGPAKVLKKFDLDGNPVNFTAGSGAGTNRLDGADAPTGAFLPNLAQPSGVAVNQVDGKVYIADYGHNVVDVYQSTGAYDSQLAVSGPTGVAIHPTSGNTYVASQTTDKVFVFPSSGGPATSFDVIAEPTGVAVSATGEVYVVNGSQTVVYDSSGLPVKTLVPTGSRGVTINPQNGDVFINKGDQFLQFDSSGGLTGGSDGAGAPVGTGVLFGSTSIVVGLGGDVYLSNQGGTIRRFFRTFKPDSRVDSPLVLHGVAAPEVRRTADFQVTSSGDYAVFSSTLDLDESGYHSAGKQQLFRYSATEDRVDCVSCNPTAAIPSSDARLASNGTSIADDGRVFFNTSEALSLRDTNSKQDAYEWNDSRLQVISTGKSRFGSSLLSVTADGTDALFFTRDTLATGDSNGTLMKLYDARVDGGFFVIPDRLPCAASDECHGRGSQEPGPADVNSAAGTLGNAPRIKRCGKHAVRRHGRCIRKHRPRKHSGPQSVKKGGR